VRIGVAKSERARGKRKVVYFAGANDFPHSMQDDLVRGVINPQNGHILGDAKPRAGGLRDANRCDRVLAILTSRLRTSSRSSRKVRSMSDPVFSLSFTRHIEDDTSRLAMLCKIAHYGRQGGPQIGESSAFAEKGRASSSGDSEQCRSAIAFSLCDHDV
jgi:hypothetical protein